MKTNSSKNPPKLKKRAAEKAGKKRLTNNENLCSIYLKQIIIEYFDYVPYLEWRRYIGSMKPGNPPYQMRGRCQPEREKLVSSICKNHCSTDNSNNKRIWNLYKIAGPLLGAFCVINVVSGGFVAIL